MIEDYSSDFSVPNASPAAPSSPEAVSMDLDMTVGAPPSHSIPAPAPISSPRAVPAFHIQGAANAAPHSSPTPLVPLNQNRGGARARGRARNRGQARGRGLDPARVRGRGRGFVPAPVRGQGRFSGSNSLPQGPVCFVSLFVSLFMQSSTDRLLYLSLFLVYLEPSFCWERCYASSSSPS
jgi:hypothetical protein